MHSETLETLRSEALEVETPPPTPTPHHRRPLLQLEIALACFDEMKAADV